MATFKDGKLSLKIASYNIAAGRYNRDLAGIVHDICECSADIIGLQELDIFVNRSGKIDMLSELAEACGYKYKLFARAMDYDGGEYGTGILSKYPINSFSVTPLDGTPYQKETRSVGIAEINTEGECVRFLNTHIAHKSPETRRVHFEHLATILSDFPSYIITGDFNTDDFDNFVRFHNSVAVNNRENYLPSFAPDEKAIDNIVMSCDWSYREAGLLPHKNSDHRLLFATLEKEF